MNDLDAINRNILRKLQKNGRISNLDLAEKVGLSPSACLRRVQELERSGVIQGYRAVVNRAATGGGFLAYVTVGLSRHTKADQTAFSKAMERAPEAHRRVETEQRTGAVVIAISGRD